MIGALATNGSMLSAFEDWLLLMICCQFLFSHPSPFIRPAELGKVKPGSELRSSVRCASKSALPQGERKQNKIKHLLDGTLANFRGVNTPTMGHIHVTPLNVNLGRDTNNSSPEPVRAKQENLYQVAKRNWACQERSG